MAVGVDRLEVLLITKPPAQPTTHHTAAAPQGAVEGGGSRSEGEAASDEYEVPAAGAIVIPGAANAGVPANSDEPRATTAPSAKPLRVRFLDMYVSFFSWLYAFCGAKGRGSIRAKQPSRMA